jgi:predicted ATPase
VIEPERGFAAALAGRYRIEREIGRGGMATVWLAEDLRHHRPVALKVLAPHGTGAIGRKRFAREIAIVARLVHPHIVPLFDSGESAGFLWFAMPHIAGESLRARLAREGRVPVAEAVRLLCEVASALGHAHRHGIVHRDLKPENVLLADGVALVADFGIAALSGDATRDEAGALTRPGAVPGTPRYASPEQILGGPLDARSDLYSLGCVAYELLAGRAPFDGPTPEARARLRLTTDPPTLLELGQIVPPAVSAAIARALARSREDRFETAARFAEALTVPAASLVTPSAAAPTPAPHNLPRERSRFVGREREREECARILAESRLLTLTGLGGGGKTRLALRVAADALASFPDGAWFVDLAPVADPSRVASTVAETLGVREEADLPATGALARHLSGRRLLLVLDNCEHVRPAAAELADSLLDAADAVRIVATSREALEVAGERRVSLGPLGLPAPGDAGAERIGEAEAVRLFVDRARAADASFALDAESAPLVAEICRRLDGIPLALELAAARVRLLSPGQIRDRLDDRFRLLAGGRDPKGRHATLEATLDWSWSQLEEDDARLLRALSVFAGGWTLEAAAAVAVPAVDGPPDEFAVMDGLARLLDRSLVTVRRERNEPPRYRLLETVRQYARARLEAAGETAVARARHAAWFAARAENAWRDRIAREEAWSAWLEAEHDNLRAALDTLAGADDE